MKNLWQGRFKKGLNAETKEFNASIKIDSAMFEEDILGSIAHAKMLGKQNIISNEDSTIIINTLAEILEDIKCGTLKIDFNEEDIHTFIENELTKRIGDVGKKLHTARSRNDQVALDSRLYVMKQVNSLIEELKEFLSVLTTKAEENIDTIMPGYTHMQRAQPVTFAHHLLAYASMIMRDITRLQNTYNLTNVLPLGSCALAGTTFNTDREFVKNELNFNSVCINSMDGVSDRDYMIQLASDIAIIMMHLSRFSEEVILWCSWEFKFIELDEEYSTGSSIMPQKKNPDMAELIRGKTGRVYGNLMALLTLMKGLPLAYNKDMQEDKELIFDSLTTSITCVKIFADMIKTATVIKENMLNAVKKGFINATDCADYLTGKNMPFRTAYKITGELVAYALEKGKTLEDISLSEYKTFSDLFEEDVYTAINVKNCVEKRKSFGGPAKESVQKQINYCKEFLNND